MKHTEAFSFSVDEYLEEMYRCELAGKEIINKGIAKELRISMPSVSEMLKKLAVKGLIDYEPRGPVSLTPRGRAMGKSVYRKNETIRRFFIMLGFGNKKAAEEACRLEHTLSDTALRKLEVFLKVRK